MLELERRTGSSQLSRLEFALWGHTTNPSCDLNEVVDQIWICASAERQPRPNGCLTKVKLPSAKKSYDKKADNFF